MAGNVPNCDWQEQSHILSNLGNPITTQISADSLSKVTAQFESLLNCTTSFAWCVPETWFTVYSGDMLNTLHPNGFLPGSTRQESRSKNPRS